MNSLKFKFLANFNFKLIVRENFNFLIDKFNFKETNNEKLVIEDWLINGVAYNNNDLVICFIDDIRERRFITIIYYIQKDFIIPFDNKSKYFTLKTLLDKINLPSEFVYREEYDNLSELKQNIESTILILNNSNEVKRLLFNRL